jgi:hypothetical protein
MRVLAAVLLCPLLLLGAQESRPLPDHEVLFKHTRENLVRAQREQRDFAYKERRTELRMNPFGALGTGPTHLYEVVPLREGGFTRTLLERDGKRVTDVEMERIEPRNRGRRRDRSGPSPIDDAIAMLEFKIDRRERLHGRDIIVVSFAPKRNARPQTREGRLVRAFTGKVWVDEADREVVKSESIAFEDITYGFGLVARLNKGTVVTLTRERVEPNLWLPTSMRFVGQGRALLIRKLNVDFGVDWFDYRRIAP